MPTPLAARSTPSRRVRTNTQSQASKSGGRDPAPRPCLPPRVAPQDSDPDRAVEGSDVDPAEPSRPDGGCREDHWTPAEALEIAVVASRPVLKAPQGHRCTPDRQPILDRSEGSCRGSRDRILVTEPPFRVQMGSRPQFCSQNGPMLELTVSPIEVADYGEVQRLMLGGLFKHRVQPSARTSISILPRCPPPVPVVERWSVALQRTWLPAARSRLRAQRASRLSGPPVASDHRRSGHATTIRGATPVIVEPRTHWKNAVGFYRQVGLTITHHQNSSWCREAPCRLDLRSQ